MERRFEVLRAAVVRNVVQYHRVLRQSPMHSATGEAVQGSLPSIVVIISELAGSRGELPSPAAAFAARSVVRDGGADDSAARRAHRGSSTRACEDWVERESVEGYKVIPARRHALQNRAAPPCA